METERLTRTPSLTPLLLAGVLACGGGADSDAGPSPADSSPGADTSAAAEEGTAFAAGADWPVYGGDPGQRRFSELASIDRRNVGGLERAWSLRTGVPGVFEATPIARGGDLFLSTPTAGGRQVVLRVEGASGAVVWRRSLSVDAGRADPSRASRGVAVGDGRVYVGTLDARVVALDASTGETAWEVRTADPAAGYQHKQAPLHHHGTLYIGVSGGPLGIRGFVKALDAATGDVRWTWHSIPSPSSGGWWGEWTDTAPGLGVGLGRDLGRERADSVRYAGTWRRGGGAPWMTPTLDPERGLLYVGVGNPAPELSARTRPGDNRWTSSVCAVRTADGTTAWCFQIVPHDRWGIDAASPPILLPHGQVGHFSKLGVLYVWEGAEGSLVDVSEPYVPQRNLLAVPTREGVTVAPGIYGGTEWSPGAYSPATGLAYTAALHAPGRYFVRGNGSVGFDLGSAAERFGVLAALDPATGTVAWADTTRAPLVGGVLATAGGLVFSGLLDGALVAWDAESGERLWSDRLPYGCASAPMTYRAGGRQHVAVACGGHFLAGGGRGDQLVAYALPSPP